MDLEALSKRFFVRALETEDVDIIYDLCSKNKLFYEFHQPFVTRESILDDRNRDTDHSGSSGSNEKRRLSGNPLGRRLWESAKLRVLEQK